MFSAAWFSRPAGTQGWRDLTHFGARVVACSWVYCAWNRISAGRPDIRGGFYCDLLFRRIWGRIQAVCKFCVHENDVRLTTTCTGITDGMSISRPGGGCGRVVKALDWDRDVTGSNLSSNSIPCSTCSLPPPFPPLLVPHIPFFPWFSWWWTECLVLQKRQHKTKYWSLLWCWRVHVYDPKTATTKQIISVPDIV